MLDLIHLFYIVFFLICTYSSFKFSRTLCLKGLRFGITLGRSSTELLDFVRGEWYTRNTEGRFMGIRRYTSHSKERLYEY